ncbi:MAG TPA: S8 family serine peptidase, partial [Rhodothermia bacterium]
PLSFANLINALRAVGVTTFAAAGNNSSAAQMILPACLSGVVSVGATNDFDQIASFSNTNLYTDLLAPGVGILAGVPGGGVATYSGTSMASPHAVGCVALQIEAGRAIAPGAIEAWLKGSGVPVTDARNGLTFPRVDCLAEPSYEPPGNLLATAGPPDGTGECGGIGTYTLNVIGGAISRVGDTGFNHSAVGSRCWQFSDQYTRVYVVADDPAALNHWESPSGHINLIDGHNGTSTTTIETSFNLLGQSPTFEAVHNGGSPTGDLLTVNNLSGMGSIIGPLSGGSSSVYPAVAVHPTTEVMYAGGGDGAAVLHSVDQATGAVTPIGSAGSGISRIAALDFRSDGTLFASVKVGTSGGPGADYLATINTASGAATLIGSFGACAASCSIAGMGAIAFDPGGVLYGALHGRAQNGSPGLYTINSSTGVASFVAPIVDASSLPPSGGITSLQFLDGALYGGTAIAKSPPGDGGWLVSINKTTGAFTKIGGASATGGRGLIGMALGPPGTPPENDDLAGATTVGLVPYSASGSTENATTEPSEAFGSCASDHGFSIWWTFTATTSDLVEVNTNGSAINTALSVWTGSGHPLAQFDCDDDSGVGNASRVIFDATAGTQYFIRVIGVAGQEGSVNINATPPAMTNDDLARAIPVGPLPSSVTGTNVGATTEPAEQLAYCGYDIGNSVWWSFTPTGTGSASVNTEGSNFDTMLGIWTGSGHPLTQIACDDDGGTGLASQITFDATAGVTYYLRVTGYGGSAGDVVLNSSLVAPFSCGNQNEIPEAECDALVALYDSTAGGDWTSNGGWKVTNTPCSWLGVICSGSHVQQLTLDNNSLVGQIPVSLGNLSDLTWLNLSTNNLTGPIPSSLGNLTNCFGFHLSVNNLTGPVPEWLGSMSQMGWLDLGGNSLTGSIPESVGNLANLGYLYLGSNSLTGTIPSSLGNLTGLQGLGLSGNSLTGTVPLPVAKTGFLASGGCSLTDNDPSLCVPDTPPYQALATGGYICGLPLDPTCEPVVHLDGKVFLEGPFAGGAMHPVSAFTDSRPDAQPYSDSFFDGTALDHDNPDVVSSPPDSVFDWVLVSLRSGPSKASEVVGSMRVAFLLENGSIVDTSGAMLAFPGVGPAAYHLVVRHRNHAGVMSADTLDLSDGIGLWDFTTSMAQAYSTGGSPMKDLGSGDFGMFACDANADGQVTAPDFNLWNASTTAGETGYRQADCNMDGQVTAPDFNLWNANTTAGAGSKVPY